jgi:oxaloacetate decarboxylase gamma subunit
MTPSELLLEGVELMLFGVGSVFAFLVLLIGCIRLMSFVIGRFDIAPIAPPAAAVPAVSTAAEVDADVIAAIQAAIHQHRARRG